MKDTEKNPTEAVAEEGPEALGALTELLGAPFDETEVKFKPAVVSGSRALALPYVDARAIQDRLDEALGVAGWQDEYECLPDGSVVCRLRLKINGEWITKMDVGGPSEQPDEGDRRKAAFSDALKRAAVKFGIGRYLYRQEPQWVEYDPQKKKFAKPPRLPVPVAPRKAPMPEPVPPPIRMPEPAGKGRKDLPATGEELQKRLYSYDRQLASQGLCSQGDLVKFIVKAGQEAGHDGDLTTWTGAAILLAVEQTKVFEKECRQKKGPRKDVA